MWGNASFIWFGGQNAQSEPDPDEHFENNDNKDRGTLRAIAIVK